MGARRCLYDVSVATGESSRNEQVKVRAGQRRQDALLQASPHQKAHLLKALNGGLTRIGDVAFITGAGKVALRHAAIIVARPDQAIEIDFMRIGHGLRSTLEVSVREAMACVMDTRV